jgi:hypothetical protein
VERPTAPVGPVHHRRNGEARAIGSGHGAHIEKSALFVAVRGCENSAQVRDAWNPGGAADVDMVRTATGQRGR